MKPITHTLLTVFLIVTIITTAGEVFPKSEIIANPEIEKALLAEEWKVIAEKSGPDETLLDSPVLRAIKGHAYLALNRNNESFLLFLSLRNEADRKAWWVWTEDIAMQNPRNPVAQYLKGDALARLSNHDLAIHSYNKALEQRPDMALALIARGVAYAVTHAWDKSLKDLEQASEMKNPLAEAYASLGTLLILKKAPDGAIEAYNKALDLSPGYILAYNGLGCAYYGSNKWEEANKKFVEAAKSLPLPLFLGNLRSLGVAAENLHFFGSNNSPLFRFTDFLDWDGLRKETAKAEDLLYRLLGYQLPEKIDAVMITNLNKAVETPHFFKKIKDKIDLKEASKHTNKLIKDTRTSRGKKISELSKKEKENIVLLNRLLLENNYPLYIAKYNQRDPGMQLTLTQRLVDSLAYKKSLTPAQIVTGQWNMDHIGSPVANALETSGIPVVAFIGKELNNHIKFSTETNRIALQSKYRIRLETVRPGGVTTDMRRAFIDQEEWPVTNWFGLAQSVSYSASPATKK